MGFLDRAIKRGLGNAVSSAVEKGVRQAVEPKLSQAAAGIADKLSGAAQGAVPPREVNQTQLNESANALGGILGSYAGAVQNLANEAAKNMKICPSCGEAAGADVKFCPSCGGKLPEQTLAQGAVCPSCGKQNGIGEKFCGDCGTKLPAEASREQSQREALSAALAKWSELLPDYPAWSFGGSSLDYDASDGCVYVNIRFDSYAAARAALESYRQLLVRSGFHAAGQYPDEQQLYNRIGGRCCHVDLEHCFDGGGENLSLQFSGEEPTGGYDYVKPEPGNPLGGLFGKFKF